MKLKFFLSLIVVLSFVSNIPAQESSYYEWMQIGLEFGSGDKLNNVVLDADTEGNLIAAGSYTQFSDYMYIYKISRDGDFLWKVEDESEGRILDLKLDDKNNIYVAGYSYTVFPISAEDTLFVKKISGTSNSLEVEWTYRMPIGNDGFNIVNRKASLLQLDSSIVVTGINVTENTLSEILTIKLNYDGNEIWSNTYSNDELKDVSPSGVNSDNSGNIYIYGNSANDDSSSGLLIAYASDGSLLWANNIIKEGSTSLTLLDAALTSESIWMNAEIEQNILLTKYLLDGSKAFEIELNSSKSSLGVFTDESENIYSVCADTVYKFNSTGELISLRELPAQTAVDYSHFDISENNSFSVVGQRDNFYLTDIDFNLNINSAFEINWRDPEGFHYESSTPFTVTSDENDRFISGMLMIYDSTNFNSHSALATVKYSQLPSGIISGDDILKNFYLSQNYPNPFNPTTNIMFNIASGAKQSVNTTLKIYDVLGRELKTLLNKPMQSGNYEVKFDGSDFSSGVYFYRLTSGKFVQTRKMLLLK